MSQRFMRIFLRFGVVGLWVLFVVVTNGKISFVLFCFVAKSLVSVGELNFSQYFLNERYRVASFKVSFASFKVFSD